MSVEVRYYQTSQQRQPFADWIAGLRDRGKGPHPGASRAFQPVYFARLGQLVVLLLCGGDKQGQDKDIERAKDYFQDYKARTAPKRPRGSR